MKKLPQVLVLWLALWSGCILSMPAFSEDGSLAVQLDNDLLFGTDRQYTGGLKILWTEPTLRWVDVLFTPLQSSVVQSGFGQLNDYAQNDQFELSMEIYTLKGKSPNGEIISLGNTAWNRLLLRRFYQKSTIQYTADLRLGWIGPENRGEDIQNGIHTLIGNENVAGWNNQPPNRLTVELGFDAQKVLYVSSSQKLQMFGSVFGGVGRPETSVSGGLGFVYAEQAKPVFTFFGFNHLSQKTAGWGWFLYSQASVQHKLYDELLNDHLFSSNEYKVSESSLLLPRIEYGAGVQYHKMSVVLHGTSIGQAFSNQTESIFRYASLIMIVPF